LTLIDSSTTLPSSPRHARRRGTDLTTRDFLERLEPLAPHPLHGLPGPASVPGGCHITEIEAATVHAMDCGGTSASWGETVPQILPPASPRDEPPMAVAKFLAIFERVAAGVPVREDAYVRVEYGEVGALAVDDVPVLRRRPEGTAATTAADAGCRGTKVSVAGGDCC
jgi:hypothetical protein